MDAKSDVNRPLMVDIEDKMKSQISALKTNFKSFDQPSSLKTPKTHDSGCKGASPGLRYRDHVERNNDPNMNDLRMQFESREAKVSFLGFTSLG